MLECLNEGLEGLGGLEGKGTREKIRGRREKMSILELELPTRTSILWGTGNREQEECLFYSNIRTF